MSVDPNVPLYYTPGYVWSVTLTFPASVSLAGGVTATVTTSESTETIGVVVVGQAVTLSMSAAQTGRLEARTGSWVLAVNSVATLTGPAVGTLEPTDLTVNAVTL